MRSDASYDEKVRDRINARLRGTGRHLSSYCADVVDGGDVDELSEKFVEDLDASIDEGVREVWGIADSYSCDIADEARSREKMSPSEKAILAASAAFLLAFLSRKGRTTIKEVSRGLAEQTRTVLGVLTEKSAEMRAKQLGEYIKKPQNIILDSKEAAPQPSIFSRIRRHVVTEIATAYRTAEYHAWQMLPFVVAQEIRLGKKHPAPDMCDDLQGIYPKDFFFTGWHPHCRCFARPVFSWEGEKVTEMPESFNAWMERNADRIERAREKGTLPTWIMENGRFVTHSMQKSLMALQGTEILPAAKLTTKELNQLSSNIREMSRKANLFGKAFEIDFSNVSDGTLMEWKDGKFIVSTTRYRLKDGSVFCPVENLRSAIAKLKEGKSLSFFEEYSIECVFHESVHARATRKAVILAGSMDEMIAETCTQLYARDRYVKILKAYGVEAVNFGRIQTDGLGYNLECSKLRGFFVKDGALQVGELINIANETEYGSRIMIKKLMRLGCKEKNALKILINLI